MFLCNTILGSSFGVQKDLAKNLFFLEIIGGGHIYVPPPVWNKLYQSPRGIGLNLTVSAVSCYLFESFTIVT